MRPFEDINTSLPYEESDEYVMHLVAGCRDNAAGGTKSPAENIRPWLYGLASAAAVAAIALLVWKPVSDDSGSSPIDVFLAGLGEEEVQMIADWAIEDIPEYY